jgi:hypothetical protein
MELVHRKRAESTLPEVAAPPLSAVDPGRVPAVRSGQSPAESLGGFGNRDQVNVIRHQAVGPDGDAVAAAGLGQELPVEAVVRRFQKRRLAPIASLGDVVRISWKDESSGAWHMSRKDAIGRP